MSTGLRVLLGLVVACLVAWLAALVFRPEWVPTFLIPPGAHIKDGGGDQPPIIISDGSVRLHTDGYWSPLVGNAYQSHSKNPRANSADWLEVQVLSGADGSPTCSGDLFRTRDLELDGGSGAGPTDVYHMTVQGGMAQVDKGGANPPTNPPPDLDFGEKAWGLLELKATTLGNQTVDCVFRARPWLVPPPPFPVPWVHIQPK